MNEYANYDEFIGFDYLDYNDWMKYVKEYVIPLNENAQTILSLRDFLTNEIRENIQNIEKYEEILLGGISKKGEYEENSIAKIYKDSLGIYIDPAKWIIPKRRDLNPYEGDLIFEREKSPLIILSKKINRICSEILSKFDFDLENSRKEIEKFIQNPNKLVDILEDLYVNIINFSANYNQQTFFIMNFQSIPRYYAENAYNKLKKSFNEFVGILGLEKIFSPSLNNKELKQNYIIWGYSKNSLGHLLSSLQIIFEIFFSFDEAWISYNDKNDGIDPKILKNLFDLRIKEPINLKKDYLRKIKESINFPSRLKLLDEKIELNQYNSTLQLAVKKDTIYHITNGYSPNTNYAYIHLEKSLPLLEFIDIIAPYLFTGIATLKEIEGFNYSKIIPFDERDSYKYLEFTNYWSA